MFEVFKEYGLELEVFILSRRDKCGKRYGFVRFRKVTNERIMAAKLDSIHIQGNKIYANILRFQCGVNAENSQAKPREIVGSGQQMQSERRVWNSSKPGLTYALEIGNKNSEVGVRANEDKLFDWNKNRRRVELEVK